MTDEEKAEEIAKGFSVIEINGVTFHSMQEMLVYMNNLRKENAELSNSVLEFSNSVIELTNIKTELENKVTELEKQIEKARLEGDENLWRVSHQLEELLKIAKDKGVVKSWYTNGTYHWELAE